MSTKTLTFILLGGARRVTLAEQIRDLLKTVGYEARFLSVEKNTDFYPISGLAKIIAGPSFQDASFSSWLADLLQQHAPAIPIACMDAVLPPLAALSGTFSQVICSTPEGAQIALDKVATATFCLKNSIPHPELIPDGAVNPCRVSRKPRYGFGSKGLSFHERGERIDSDSGKFIVQTFIAGDETTHDLYINRDGSYVCSSRDRIAVIDGEVDHCRVRHPDAQETAIMAAIAGSGLFFGPLTVQTMRTADAQVFLIEINARLGGGVTASIAAGFPVIEMLLKEAAGLSLPARPRRQLEMKRARRDFYHYLDTPTHPNLMKLANKVLAIDIDGTICTELRAFDRPLAQPLPGAIDALRLLKANGNTIILWTGRGWEQYAVTKDWLDRHGCVYDQILMGKPVVNHFIDDRAVKFMSWDTVNV
jgi:carbamoyl-phosphate synthase large subunit